MEELGVTPDELFLGIVESGYSVKTNKLAQLMGELPLKDQKYILAIVETMIKQSK